MNPTFFYGLFTQQFPLPAPDFGAISTNLLIYNLLFADGAFPFNTWYIDVRDVALAHIRALSSPPTAEVGRKRIVFSSPHGWPHQKTLDLIAEQRPALKARLITVNPTVQEGTLDVLPMDFKRVEELLGMKDEDFHPIEAVCVCNALMVCPDQPNCRRCSILWMRLWRSKCGGGVLGIP